MEHLPKRKANRLPDYNYSSSGAYFITICAREKQCIFGKGLELLPNGRIVQQQMEKMAHFYTHVRVDKYVIMPNHVHLLLIVEVESASHIAANHIVPQFVSTLKRFSNKLAGDHLWQRSYHDHIIRDEEDYRRIWQYIDTNPVKWNEDCYFAED